MLVYEVPLHGAWMQATKPSYRQLEAILKGIQGSSSSQTWAQRLRSEFAFNKESLNRKN